MSESTLPPNPLLPSIARTQPNIEKREKKRTALATLEQEPDVHV